MLSSANLIVEGPLRLHAVEEDVEVERQEHVPAEARGDAHRLAAMMAVRQRAAGALRRPHRRPRVRDQQVSQSAWLPRPTRKEYRRFSPIKYMIVIDMHE